MKFEDALIPKIGNIVDFLFFAKGRISFRKYSLKVHVLTGFSKNDRWGLEKSTRSWIGTNL